MPYEHGAADQIKKEFPSVSPGAKFLHERNNNLHVSPEVEHAVSYLRLAGEQIPNEPATKVDHYLGFLANKEYVNDGILTGDQRSINRQIDAQIIESEDVPESYFELQRRIAREQGHGEVTITDEMRRQLIEAVQVDQRAGLATWVEYIGGDDGSYPDWFKYYAWNSIIKMGSFDKEKGEFQRRSKGTTAPYPDLNREALAYVFDNLNKKINGEKIEGSQELKQLLNSANFGKLYAHAVLETLPGSPELMNSISGSWTKFDQNDDPRTARRLAGSLQGHGTGWCTAGESTAEIQLKSGDFYVYYTKDEDGKDSVPRVAIRMENGQVREVRGVNPQQELEPKLFDITLDRLKNLPGGDVYLKKAEDMRRLTTLDNKLKAEPDAELSKDELAFLYETDGAINGFGYARDPRISELRSRRDAASDLAKIFDLDPDDRPRLIKVLATSKNSMHMYIGEIIEETPALGDETARVLIDAGCHYLVSKYISHFKNLGDEVAKKIDFSISEDLDSFTNLSQETYLTLIGRNTVTHYSNSEIWKLLKHADKFNISDTQKVADLLISTEIWDAAARLPEFFPGIDHMAIARQFMAADKAHFLSPGYYPEIDDNIFADAWLEHNPYKLVSWLGDLDVDKNAYIRKLIEAGKIGDLASQLNMRMDGIDKELVAQIDAERENQKKRAEEGERRREEQRLKQEQWDLDDQRAREELGDEYWNG